MIATPAKGNRIDCRPDVPGSQPLNCTGSGFRIADPACKECRGARRSVIRSEGFGLRSDRDRSWIRPIDSALPPRERHFSPSARSSGARVVVSYAGGSHSRADLPRTWKMSGLRGWQRCLDNAPAGRAPRLMKNLNQELLRQCWRLSPGTRSNSRTFAVARAKPHAMQLAAIQRSCAPIIRPSLRS